MSGGGRRGEVRIRNARPLQKQAGGTHNRKARRAADAQRRGLFEPALESLEAFVARREARRRAEREAFWAGKTDADIEAMSLERSESEWQGLGGQWFLPLLLDAIPRWVTRHYRTDPKERERRAHELGYEVISHSQGAAAIAEPDARASDKGEIAKVFNALAEGIAIGAYCPGGATAAGMRWEVSGTELRVTHRLFCACYPMDDPNYWDTEPCANLIDAASIYVAEAE